MLRAMTGAMTAPRAGGAPTSRARSLAVVLLAPLAVVALGGCSASGPVAPPPRLESAHSRLERECGAGTAAACARLASQLASDPASADRSLQLQARACELGDGPACVAVARAGLSGPSEARGAAGASLARACELGAASGCLQLAGLHRRGVLVAADLGRARELTSRACLGNAPLGCGELGRMQQRGLGGAPDPRAALASYRRGCEHHDALACFELGRATELGRGVAADPAAAYDLYRRAVRLSESACEAADLEGCQRLGQLLVEGSGTATDRSRGLELQRQGCDAGYPPACLSWWTRSGSLRVAEADRGQVAGLAQACDRGAGDACLLVARVAGAAPAAAGPTLRQLLDRGCALGTAAACTAAALERVPADDRGRAQLERACALGDAPGCHTLGLTLELEGDGLDAAPALERHRHACQSGLAVACTRLGSLRFSAVGGASDAHAAATSWERGCGLGDPRACFELGVLLQDGRQVAARAKAGHEYLERACRGGEGAACTRLGSRLWRGVDGEQDRARGQQRLMEACSQLEPRACLELADAARRGEVVMLTPERLDGLVQRAGVGALAACEDAVAVCRDGEASTLAATRWVERDGLPARLPASWPECGIGLERRCEQAHQLLATRCASDAASCFRAARLTDTLLERGLGGRAAERDRLDAEGLRRSTRACAGGDASSCRLAAGAERHGWGTKADPGGASLLEAKACKLEPDSCSEPAGGEPPP